MVYAPGVLVGRAFDAGYLYVDCDHTFIPLTDICLLTSHHMMVAGSIIQVFSMFMLSLAHREQYYQVNIHHNYDRRHPFIHSLGFPHTSFGHGTGAVFTFHPVHQRHRTPF